MDNIPTKPGIYLLSINGRYYIGQSTNLRERIRQHIGCQNKDKLLYRQLKHSLASGSFSYKILYVEHKQLSKKYLKSKLNKLEIKFIRLYDTFLDGWNQTIGGEQPSQSIHKYYLDLKLTKNYRLKQKLL